jgi:Ca2+/Na+ antiporter
MDGNVIAYNIANFVGMLFVLEFGADKFIEHSVIVARRTGIPESMIALLTAGAEWKELGPVLPLLHAVFCSDSPVLLLQLIVVVALLAQGRPSLAIGNMIGSAISNILGAFSLGLLFRQSAEHVRFDRNSRIHSLFCLSPPQQSCPSLTSAFSPTGW